MTLNNDENINTSQIRMFYSGAELKNENYLYQHELRDDVTVNVMIRK